MVGAVEEVILKLKADGGDLFREIPHPAFGHPLPVGEGRLCYNENNPAKFNY
jgi:hypothetical protein